MAVSPYCLLTIIRVPCRSVGSSHHLIECASLSMLTAVPIPSRCRLTNGAAAPITLPANRPAHRVGGRGGGCAWMSSDVMRSIPLICDSRGHSPLSSMPASSNHLIHLITFLSSPRPLSLALSCLLALNNPPPPGVGGADGRTICDCGRGVDLLASHHAVPLSRSRSLATAAAPCHRLPMLLLPFHLPPASSSSVPPIESIPPRRHHHASTPVLIPVNRSPP